MRYLSVQSSVVKLFRNIKIDSKVSVDKYNFVFSLQTCTTKQCIIDIKMSVKNCSAV